MALAGDNGVLGSVILPLHTYRRLIIELFLFIVLAGDNGVLGVGDTSYAYQRDFRTRTLIPSGDTEEIDGCHLAIAL